MTTGARGFHLFPCDQCRRVCKSTRGLTQHVATVHRALPQLEDTTSDFHSEHHPWLTGAPCDCNGNFLPPGTPPTPPPSKSSDDWTPFLSRTGFELAELLYRKAHISQTTINLLLSIWAATLIPHGDSPPITDHQDLHAQIDAIKLGSVPWKSYAVQYQGLRPLDGPVPEWMETEYQLWYRDPRRIIHNLFANPEFASSIDYAPRRDFRNGIHQYRDFMSGDWAWEQCDIIAMDPSTHGSMFVPIVLGTDKTTVSVATGQHSYHPVYLSVGNVHNCLRRAHRDALVLISFLPIPKGSRDDAKSEVFRDFRRRLYHGCMTAINEPIKEYMLRWDIIRCCDQHFRRAVYGLGPHIMDYPEQSLAAGTVYGWCVTCDADSTDLDGSPAGPRSREQLLTLLENESHDTLWFHYGIVPDFKPYTTNFPRADIHKLLTPDLLHQAIKGTFKDHLVSWVEEYLKLVYGSSDGARILDEIDRRIALVPLFPGLRRFKQGRNFQQWTGNDSKAFMKVFTHALEGYVPVDIIKTFTAFLDFCYIAHQDTISETSLDALNDALERFHNYRNIFQTSGVRPTGFSLPRQHSLVHYHRHIRQFGAPNGLSSSITESKHITAVKQPWRQTSRYEALGQMLKINTRNDKLAAARVDFTSRGMLEGTCVSEALEALESTVGDISDNEGIMTVDSDGDTDDDSDDGDDDGDNDNGGQDLDADDEDLTGPADELSTLSNITLAQKRARGYPVASFWALGQHIQQEDLENLVRRFLFYHEDPTYAGTPPISICPTVDHVSNISVFHSATATFCAPSNTSGIGGMYREMIRSTPKWKTSGIVAPRRDCILLNTEPDAEAVGGLGVARVHLFFSFEYKEEVFQCALVLHFCRTFTEPDPDNGMWIVEPDYDRNGSRLASVVHLDSIVRAAHLLPIFRANIPVPREVNFTNTLDVFTAFYLNKYIDYHAFETLS